MLARLLCPLLILLTACDLPSLGRPPERKATGGAPTDAAPKAGKAAAPSVDLAQELPEAKMPLPSAYNDSEQLPVSTSPWRGGRDAKVTILEFSDLECPYCNQGRQVMNEVAKKYGDQVRIVWKNLPLTEIHPNALPGAIALMALARQGNEQFWAAEELLFERQSEFGGRGASQMAPQDFERFFTQLPNIDFARWKRDLKDQALLGEVLSDFKLAEYVEAQATPTFFVNGRKVEGALPLERLSGIIDAELAAVDALIAKGTAPDKTYAARVKANLITADTRFSVAPTGPAFGATAPKITIVAFSDFQCPYCGKGDEAVQRVLENHPQDVRVVYRNLPLIEIHPDAVPAAEAALAAHEQGKYLAYHKKLFENQRALSRQDLERYATELGLDMKKFRAALDDHRFQEQIVDDMKAAMSLGIDGTPAYFVNGKVLRGAVPTEALEQFVVEELKLADALLSKGVKREDLYKEITKDAYSPLP